MCGFWMGYGCLSGGSLGLMVWVCVVGFAM